MTGSRSCLIGLVVAIGLLCRIAAVPAQVPPVATQPPTTDPATSANPTPPANPPAPPAPMGIEWPTQIEGRDLKSWLADLRESPDGAVRQQALRVIPQFGPPARKESLDALVAALSRESDPSVRVNILILLGNIAPENALEGKKVVDPIKHLLANSPNGSVYRLYAARALMNMPNYAQDTLPQFKAASEDASWETRREVARALGIIFRTADEKKGPSPAVLDLLTARLKAEKSAAVRMEIVQSLLLLGPPAYKDPADYPRVVGPYFKAITDHMKTEKDKAILVWLHMLVMRYDGSQLNETTIKKIADNILGGDLPARVAALRALALLESRTKPFLSVIMDAVRLDDPITKIEALSALAALRNDAREVVPQLEKLKSETKDEELAMLYGQTIDAILGKKPMAAPMVAPPPKNTP